MKKLKQARAFKLKMGAVIILFMALFIGFSTNSISAKGTVKATLSTTATCAGIAGMGMIRLYKEDDETEGGGVTAEAIATATKKAARKEAQEAVKVAIDEFVDKNPMFLEIKSYMQKAKDDKLTLEDLAAMKEGIKKMGLEITAQKEQIQKREGFKTFGQSIVDGYKLVMTDEKIKALKEGSIKGHAGEFKASPILTTSIAPTISSGVVQSLTEFFPTPVPVPRRNPFVIELINVMRTTKTFVSWIERNVGTGTITGTSENAVKNQIDFSYQERKTPVEKYTGFIKVSKEMIDDFPLIENQIRTELTTLVILKMDTDALNGTGAGSNTLNGIINQATAWSAGTFANAVDFANMFDVLKVGINQIAIAVVDTTNSYSAGFEANIVVMNPSDVTSMLIAKDTQGRYLRDLLTYPSANVIELDGVRIVANTGIAQGTFLIMDSSKVNFAMREDAMISVGYDADDFTNNRITILCETRGALWIPVNYAKAIVTGTFSVALAALKDAKS